MPEFESGELLIEVLDDFLDCVLNICLAVSAARRRTEIVAHHFLSHDHLDVDALVQRERSPVLVFSGLHLPRFLRQRKPPRTRMITPANMSHQIIGLQSVCV